jgi:hypothetical protein
MATTPNMGLTTWPNLSDNFNHTQLAANFNALDSHDHTTGKGVPVGAGGIGALAVGTSQLQDVSVTTPKLADLSTTTAKLNDLSVTTGKIVDSSVTTPKLATGAVTSPKLTPTSGLLTASGTLTATGSQQDVPGLSLSITPTVSSILLVWVTLDMGTPANVSVNGFLVVDGVTQPNAFGLAVANNGVTTNGLVEVAGVFRVPLTAAAHTVKVQAACASGTGAFVGIGNSVMTYLLHAA